MAQAHASDRTDFKQDIHRLGEGVDTLRADINGLAHGAVDAARSGAAELRLGARHAVESAKGRIDGARTAAADAADSLKHVIARNPVASMGIAAGVGVLIGLVVFRRRS